jgi:DNA-binding PadR family transcriptional regulator
MLELAILGLLKQQPMHGYQLSRELGESLGGFWRVSYGSLYPTLRRMERDGLVAPITGEPTGGRRKTVYCITDEGERAFLELLQGRPAHPSDAPSACGWRSLPPAARDASGC